jgi:hypothetical protein
MEEINKFVVARTCSTCYVQGAHPDNFHYSTVKEIQKGYLHIRNWG